ncbi:MAG: hypothetical protein GQF41_4056 [Candidatus Rifleibacterium amylolyticum]|nr:MAG: hypothetical protein GQF41_4056 [Candidatus Rifleibacterium amylolyticum]
MKSSNLRAHAVFLTILLVFCYFVGQSAATDINNLPESVIELLSGKTTDFTGAATQIPEHQLPSALAAAKPLKFRALHGEISLSSNEAESFETILLDRMSTARQVAFSQTKTCRKKIEQHKIMFDGQKLLVPAHFVADTNLAVIGYQPKGETGCLFPNFNIEVFSQSALIEVTLAINGQTVDAQNFLIKQNLNTFELYYRTPAVLESLFTIGTHTAEISITNKDGEKAKKEWIFTVGIESFNPEPIPEDAQLVSEVAVSVTRLINSEGLYQNVRVIVYEDGSGIRHEEYVIDTANGSIKVRNLKYLRKILTARRDAAELQVFPRSSYAFPGNPLHFSYTYSGEGSVVKSRYSLNGQFGSWLPGATYDVILATKPIEVYFEAEVKKPDPEHENETITYFYTAGHGVAPIIPAFSFDNPHSYIFTRENQASLPLKRSLGAVGFSGKFDNGNEIEITEATGVGVLKIVEFRAEIVVSSGSVELKDKAASQTEILFSTPGYIEITQYAKLTYLYGDESYSQSFKDEKSSLNALFNVHATAEFLKYPQKGLISATDILIPLKLLSLQINGEKRILKSIEDVEKPWILLKSEHYPKMEPITLKHLSFDIKDPANKTHFGFVDFGYRVYVATTDEIQALKPEFVPSLNYTQLKFDSLPEFSIFPRESKLIEVSVDPPGPQKLYEGDTSPFKAEIIPVDGMGSGVFNEKGNSLEILDFYKPVEIDHFQWLELPLMDEKAKISFKETEFNHIFDPWWGPGKYELTVDALVDFETEYGSTFYLQASNKVEVEVLPGLAILSPISDIAYPLGAALKVTTSVDDDLEKWKNIRWSLNGKAFTPSTQEAPFYITPDHAGKWSLVASLTIEADDRRKQVDLASEVKFFVQPINYELSPAKQVYPLADASELALDLIVKINGNQIEKPGDLVPWQEDILLATVDKVDWSLIQKEQGCAYFNAESDKFKTQVDFSRRGAATALATITVKLIGAEKVFNRHNPQFKNRYEEPVFELPAVRADLWAVVAGPMQNITGRFPQTAIAAAYRTYELASFTFELACIDEKKYAFNKDTGLQTVSLETALGVDTIEASNISFQWKAESAASSIHQEQELPTRFVIKPAAPCAYTVNLEVFLNFPGSNPIKLGEAKTTAEAVSLYSLIETSVEPSSFTMTLGETRTLKYLVRSLETPPPPPAAKTLHADSTDKSFLYLMNENFILTIDKVEWSYDYADSDPQVPAKKSVLGSSYDFHPLAPGTVNGTAKGNLHITEMYKNQLENKVANSSKSIDWFTYIQNLYMEILINNTPVGESEYYLGQKITLSYRLKSRNKDYVQLENPLWKISGAKVKEHDIFLGDGLPSELSDDELASENVTLFLYCTDKENFTKQIALEGRLSDKTISATASIEIKHPIWSDPSPPEIPQPVLNHYTDGPYKVFYLGYEEWNEEYPVFEPTIANNTRIGYLIAGLHLMKNNHWRKVIVNGSETEEIAQTYPSEEMWLDNKFPFLSLKAISASETKKLTSIFQDPPKVDLDEAFPRIVSEVRADAEYLFFLMVKPSASNIPAENSIWTPIKAFKWKWTGHAVKDEEGKWKEKPNSILSQGFQAIHYDKIVSWKKTALHPLNEDQSDENHIIIKWEAKP